MYLVFFFKQKTAYEMRISDWSSDVCSSDLFVFLRTWTATFIPSIVVPLSLVGTFGIMYLAGFSVNNLTLMALTIATGFVVDDAIVMIENIARYIEKGESALNAALKGAAQIGFTLVSLTLSLIAVRSDERRVGNEWVRTG